MSFHSRTASLLVVLFTAFAGLAISFGLGLLPDKPGSYTQLWKRVDSCERKGLTETARKTVLEIYERAKTENNAAQLVKAVIFRAKYDQLREEFSTEKSIAELEAEIGTSSFPATQVLHSLLADAYWNYYEMNRWKFYNRSQTVAFDNKDVATWDVKAIVYAAIRHYNASLDNPAALKTTRVDVMDEVIDRGTAVTRAWRPTLYDFLAHRALDFYKNSEADVIRAANQFALNDAVYLQTGPEFLAFKVPVPADSLELKYYAVKLLQELEIFHSKGNDDALADLEMERLSFFYANSNHPEKDSLYLTTLRGLQTRFASGSRVAELLHLEAQWWLNASGEYQPMQNERPKWHKKKAYELCAAIVKRYPNSRGAQLAHNTMLSIRRKTLSITAEEVNDTQLPNRVLVQYTNVSKVYLRLVRTDYFSYREMRNSLYGTKLIGKLLAYPAVQKSEQVLPDDRDFNMHSCEVKVPALDNGYYVLLCSDNPEFSVTKGTVTYQDWVVSGLSYIYKRSNDGRYTFYLLDRQNGQPLPDVRAQVWYPQYNYRNNRTEHKKGGSYTADRDGKISVLPDGNSGNFLVDFSRGNDHLISGDNFYPFRGPMDEVKQETQAYIFTDRAIYRPGQTVYFKSLLLEGSNNNFHVVPNRRLAVHFYDVNSQLVASRELTTNEYGTVSGSFTAPQAALTGQMRLVTDYSTTYISVEEYKRPRFEVVFDTLKGSYKLNETATVKVTARAYAGNAVDGAQVRYRVVRHTHYPKWYWYSWPPRSSAGVEISSGTGTTTADGSFPISFTALPDPTVKSSDDPVYSFEISADVTDLNGETHSSGTTFRAGYKALELDLELPEIINLNDLPKTAPHAHNLNGVEVFVSGSLTVTELKQPGKIFRKRLWSQPDKHAYPRAEFYSLFPHDPYDNETDQHSWEKGAIALTTGFDTRSDNGKAVSQFTRLKPGAYLVEAQCSDKDGQVVRSLSYVTVFNPRADSLPLKTEVFSVPIKTTAEPGDSASFIFASSYGQVHCLYALESRAGSSVRYTSPSMTPFNIPVTESERGGLQANLLFVKYGRVYQLNQPISVPFSNKDLQISYSSFRNKLLPGQKEEWKINIRSAKGEKVAAEFLATLYDASLDAFRPNSWGINLYQNFYPHYAWEHDLEGQTQSQDHSESGEKYLPVAELNYDALNLFGLSYYGYRRYGRMENLAMSAVSANAPRKKTKAGRQDEEADEKAGIMRESAAPAADAVSAATGTGQQPQPESKPPVTPRSNFSETAFFYPELRTNEQGEIIIRFTIPESLTRWKFMGLAHSKDVQTAVTYTEAVTQKELMINPNAPRFFREGDRMSFAAKISNLADKDLEGKAELRFFDALNGQDITARLMPAGDPVQFSAKKGQSAAVEWQLTIPEGYQAIQYRVMATAGAFSDGEEMAVPVLTNRMLVTESLPLPVRGGETKEFIFQKFVDQNEHSATLKNQAYTLEFTANPAWYAVQSLPYLMEYPYECSEQTAARYYANALATHIANSSPKIKAVFDAWKQSPESFLSNLEKNQELKALVLEETPWVLEARGESERKKRLALLFDLNRMSNELNAALTKLEKAQTVNGGWPWFEGCPEDWYITQHIVCSFAHLQQLGVISPEQSPRVFNMIRTAIPFCDEKIRQQWEQIRNQAKNTMNDNHLSQMVVQYLYMRSFMKGEALAPRHKDAFTYFKKQAQRYWLSQNRYLQGMIALALHRYDDKTTANDIVRSLKENALHSEEMGMYWKENYTGYYWHESPIEMQALLIETFDEVAGDTKSVDELRTWLLKSKQTQNWGTTRATTEAIYALLLRGNDWLATESGVEITIGRTRIDPKQDPDMKTEAGTGYFKKTWHSGEIVPEMGKIKVTKKDRGVSWGAVYWQYFEQLDKITPHATPLRLSKALFAVRNTASGPVATPLGVAQAKVGDRVRVRIELRADRDLEYVHLKDMRAAGFEPVNVMSGYRYQDGLSYYESTRDASTNFFIPALSKGTYVFEYDVLVSHSGDFSNGICSIQCMYAPEFTAHSEGIRLQIKK